jgi:class 3 adenylate cyclase
MQPPPFVGWTARRRRRMIVAMVRALPTGVVTLLFTDVEGSTRLLHELGDDYGEALHEHRRRLRAVFVDHEGVEVDTQGDAFFVAFARASNAVAAATDGQLALADGPIRVRMGLHTGEPRLTEEGYVGLDVHKGARIAAVGHGGQVLLSQTTRVLVDADVRDLGVHRLKDLSAPERIYQLEIDGLPGEFPLLNTLEAGMKNLPLPRTSFVGRESELEAIDRLLEDPGCRLLTLVGPGGRARPGSLSRPPLAASTATRTASTSSRSSPSPRRTSSRPPSPSRSSSPSTARTAACRRRSSCSTT